ncbi:MAG: hypothetical protein EPN98_07830 [Phenylobacterium sp.]|uniref:hypothetical protein n=1 Tax=Phenylobacterium sp. TaxID=1871053 RepID=UPI00120F2E6F|nr:hypothetical protein [Phenylobacterium sp.]TAL34958.1 MAG: hypothetical protein EPN98_07830 [Phenylobacterium sp.]
MSQSHPTGFVDRLAERGLIDRWGFLSFAFGGAVLILLAKSLQANAAVVAAGAVAAMTAYALVVQRSGSGRLRADQAGDNCYYLGLVYTLISLSYAIFTFDPADTATTIVQGFGIALSTTVMGLVLRVFFHQSRPDLVQTEDTARIELADAAGRLKAELSSMVVSFNDFGRQTRQSLEELSVEVVRSLNTAREASDAAIRAASAEANAALAEQNTEALAKAKRMSAATEKVVAGIERQAEALGKAAAATDGISAGLAALNDAASVTRAAMQAQAEQAGELNRLQAEAQASSRDLRDAAVQLVENVRALDETAGRFDRLVAARLAEVRAAPEAVVAEARVSLERALGELSTTLQATVAAQRDAAADLAARTAESLALAQGHNRALEAELGRSRENVAKVHAALVEMTGRLANRLESEVA